MKRTSLLILLLFVALASNGQSATNKYVPSKSAFKSGEWLRYRMSYSNFINAGEATIEVTETTDKYKEAFHVKGIGTTSGFISWFFKVYDDYQTYFYKETLQPYRFIRKIDEGGHTKDKEILFDYATKEATVKNFKKNTIENYAIPENIQDMLSALYYLRNQNISNLAIGEEINLQLFFDEEIYNFKLKFIGREIIRTKFGKVKSLQFMPLVQSGRVFKEQESVTIWVSDDENKIPLKIKASLAVGSLRADLDAYKGLAHPFNIIFNN
jgi:hypothetical protein